jgi:hypothetical protein
MTPGIQLEELPERFGAETFRRMVMQHNELVRQMKAVTIIHSTDGESAQTKFGNFRLGGVVSESSATATWD